MIPLEEARARVFGRCPLLGSRIVPLAEAVGCVTAAPVVAAVAVPPFVNSAMDGFAVRSIETVGADDAHPLRLAVVATVAAGERADVALRPGQAVRIMTGAPAPAGPTRSFRWNTVGRPARITWTPRWRSRPGPASAGQPPTWPWATR
ncbi:MAG: hypothetical protein WKF43_00510 [Acidimicrobiales bacterium]